MACVAAVAAAGRRAVDRYPGASSASPISASPMRALWARKWSRSDARTARQCSKAWSARASEVLDVAELVAASLE
ncbi:hypothetical protein ACTMU2_10615 [Cupriavidus basilensis]